jgi:hypothetical protein
MALPLLGGICCAVIEPAASKSTVDPAPVEKFVELPAMSIQVSIVLVAAGLDCTE